MAPIKNIPLPLALRVIQSADFPWKQGICERLFGRKLATHKTVWIQTGAGIPWKLDLGNETLRWIVYGKYEGAAFLNWAKRFLPRNGVVVDSGANIGQMLLYLAQWVPQGRLLAFEPGRHQADWLQECLDVHPVLPVELLRQSVEEAKTTFLKDCGRADRHGSWNQISASGGEPIEIVRLADTFAGRGIRRVNLWKLDVEGYEIPALRGAGEWLTERRIDAIYVELADENGVQVRNLLESHGYRCHLFSKTGRLRAATSLPAHTNGLFRPIR